MGTELKISFEGDVPGIAEHRLSLGEFGPAMAALLSAVRWIGAAVVADALDKPDYGRKGGRLKAEAELLDVQIGDVGEGSLKLALACVMGMAAGQTELFQELPRVAAERLLDAVEAEANSKLKSHMTRLYLQALPQGVTAQKYQLYEGDELIRTVQIGQMKIEQDQPAIALPALAHFVGQVVGVGFDPGDVRVLLTVEGGGRVAAAASDEQVSEALAMRGIPVRAMVLSTGKQHKLMWLAPEGSPVPSPDRRLAHLFERWDGVLKRLAQ